MEQNIAQFIAEHGYALTAVHMPELHAPFADHLHHAINHLPRRRFAFRRANAPAKILGSGNIARVIRPKIRKLQFPLLHRTVHPAPAYRHLNLFPADLVKRMDTLFGKDPFEGYFVMIQSSVCDGRRDGR